GCGGKAVRVHLALQLAVARLERRGVDGEARRQAEQLEVVLIQIHFGFPDRKKGAFAPFSAPRGRASLNVERFAAAALVLDVGIVELEALVQALTREVELGPFQELKALRIDDDLDAVALEGPVIWVDGVGVF